MAYLGKNQRNWPNKKLTKKSNIFLGEFSKNKSLRGTQKVAQRQTIASSGHTDGYTN